MNFNSSWAGPFRFIAGTDSLNALDSWGCKDKAGIYIIRDQYDSQTLYVGKAEATSCDIQDRLKAHLSLKPIQVIQSRRPGGNRGISDLSINEQTFTVRWAESRNPALSESIAIIQLEPLFNKKPQWIGIDKSTEQVIWDEAKRLGLTSPEPFKVNPVDTRLEAKLNALAYQYETEAKRLNWGMEQGESSLEAKLKRLEQQSPQPRIAKIDRVSQTTSADISKPKINPDW